MKTVEQDPAALIIYLWAVATALIILATLIPALIEFYARQP